MRRLRSGLRRLRPALAGLTTRGRSFLAAGSAAAVCAIALDQRDLLRVAILLVVLPLACVVALTLTDQRPTVIRAVSPDRLAAGDTARVRVELENTGRRAWRPMLAEDRLPHTLGAAPRFVVLRLAAGARTAVAYGVRPPLRGRYSVGPLQMRLADPFGLCELVRSAGAAAPLVAVPRVWPLAPLSPGGQWNGTGEAIARASATGGENDVSIREYRYGDDLRRVHWRATARRGELMVRRDEQPRLMRATVLLDTRADAHRGRGAASSFEWAVSAAASASVALVQTRFGVRVLVDDSPATWTSPYGVEGAGRILDDFALLDTGDAQALSGATATLVRSGGDGLVVAVLGAVDEASTAPLTRITRSGPRGLALLLRVEDWDDARAADHRLADDRSRAVAALHTAGWAVAEARRGETPTQVWARALGVASGDLGPAPRASGPVGTGPFGTGPISTEALRAAAAGLPGEAMINR